MMIVLSKSYIEKNKSKITEEIISGKIFIYPTDTIYGLGTNATLKESVEKIREIKNRSADPLSIISPSKVWIKENCHINEKVEKWLRRLPGHYTLIVKLKNKNCIAQNVNNSTNTIGIRLPNHWFTEIINSANVPFITTSANVSGKKFMTNLKDLDNAIKLNIDIIIYEGERLSKPSTIVDLTGEQEKIIKR